MLAPRAHSDVCANSGVADWPQCQTYVALPPYPVTPHAGDDEMQLVLEDDFRLLYDGAEWLQRLHALMDQLPNDWEVGVLEVKCDGTYWRLM